VRRRRGKEGRQKKKGALEEQKTDPEKEERAREKGGRFFN
jgi:hypothetical protein